MRSTTRRAIVPAAHPDIDQGIAGLHSDEYQTRSASIALLARHGEPAAKSLIEGLFRRKADLAIMANYADALLEIGRAAVPAVLAGLDRVEELRRPDDVYLLETLADLLGHFRERRAVEGLQRQMDRVRRAIREGDDLRFRSCCEAARIRLRRVLYELGDRGGLEELLSILGDGRRRVPDGLVDLLARIGNREALLPLARLHAIEESVSLSGAQLIKEAIRDIAHRDPLRAEDPLYRKAAASDRVLLERILPKAR